MVKVSVIVPVYNSEKTLDRTIKSLLNQTLEDIEFIFVNDGSNDDSLKILQKYKNKIKIINQKNSGPGGARNAGIKKAKGEYIGFLDADDIIESQMYEEMYKKAKEKNFDMVVCDTNIYYPDKKTYIKSGIDKDKFSKTEIKRDMIYSYAVIWNKIIKKNIAIDNLFSNDIYYEDIEFLFKLFPKINSIGVINKALYNYMQVEGSITYTYNDKLYDIIKVLDNIILYYKENNLYEKYFSELEYSYVRYMFGTFIKRMAKTKNKNKYQDAVIMAIDKVKSSFPDYKKNKYLNEKGLKNIYLKHFNKLMAKIVYINQKNKMN